MPVENYVILDSDGNVVNVCRWDGITPWSPPEGHLLRKQVDPLKEARGFRKQGDNFVRIEDQ